jgi:hypothetical protein
MTGLLSKQRPRKHGQMTQQKRMSRQIVVATRDLPMTVVGKIMTSKEVRAGVANVTHAEKLGT